ncbi:hypothetical protein [Streptomyces aurantiogriseus]
MTTLFDTTTVPAVNVTAGTGASSSASTSPSSPAAWPGPGWANHFRTTGLAGEDRLQHIVDTAAGYYRNADLVLIEGAAYSMAKQVGHDEMSAARWMIRCDLRRRRIPFAVVTPDFAHHLRHRPRPLERRGDREEAHPAAGQGQGPGRGGTPVRHRLRRDRPLEPGRRLRADGDGHGLARLLAGRVPKTHSRALKGVAWPTQTVAVAR